MADDTDFAALYGELGITAELTPEQFRQAYRRRVAQLHPDQRGDDADVARLQELNRLYRAALDFMRLHGRLPGAPVQHAPVQHAPMQQAAAQASHGPASPQPRIDMPDAAPRAGAGGTHGNPSEPASPKAGSGAISRWFVWMAVVAVVVLLVHACGEPDPAGAPSRAHVFDTTVEDVLGIDRIRLGMDMARVEGIQGAPAIRRGTRWEYGPSWIGFRCGGAVSDWYSAPQRPLKVDTPHPTTAEWERYDAARPPGC